MKKVHNDPKSKPNKFMCWPNFVAIGSNLWKRRATNCKFRQNVCRRLNRAHHQLTHLLSIDEQSTSSWLPRNTRNSSEQKPTRFRCRVSDGLQSRLYLSSSGLQRRCEMRGTQSCQETWTQRIIIDDSELQFAICRAHANVSRESLNLF